MRGDLGRAGTRHQRVQARATSCAHNLWRSAQVSFHSLQFSLTPSISQGTRGRSRVDVALLALSEQGGGRGGLLPLAPPRRLHRQRQEAAR